MSKKKSIESLELDVFPKALIIGEGMITDYLEAGLAQHGVQVEKKESELTQYDYIFLFGNSNLIEKFLSFLSPSGKLLFIETEKRENILPSKRLRILRVGQIDLWSVHELADKILRTMFTQGNKLDVNLRKISPSSARILTKPTLKTSSLGKEKIPDYQDLVIKKAPFLSIGRILFFIILSLFIFASTAGYIFWEVLSIKNNLSDFRSNIASANWEKATSDLYLLEDRLQSAQKIYNFSSQVLFPLQHTSFFQTVGNLLFSSDQLVKSTKNLLSFLSSFESQKNDFSIHEGLTKTEFLNLAEKIEHLERVVVSAKEQLDKVNTVFIPKESFSSILLSASDNLIAASELLPIVEKFLYSREKKVYLLLFQNNMELRPTGGFIGSYALLTLNKGKVADFKIEDVYTADGQLKGHVDPPNPIRIYLAQPHYFLRDSNFDPDFAASAARAAWFLQKELGVAVEGVVGINLFVVQDLLRTVGKIRLSDFNNEEITADNFFLKAHRFAQKNFFPGSTQKRDFLTSVASTLLTNLSFNKENVWLKILSVVKHSLEQKNLLLYSFEEDFQKLIEEKGFGGRMTEVKCVRPKQNNGKLVISEDNKNCLADYLSVVEANLGVNKANYFINKSIVVEKNVGVNRILNSTVTISYENTALAEVYPEAQYTNYLRFFIPVGSQIKFVSVNNVSLPFENLDLEDYRLDKTSVGFLVKIAPGEKKVIKVSYDLPNIFSKEVSSYQFFFQKQGGDKVSPLVLFFTYPKQLKIKPLNFTSASGRDNEIYYTTDTSVDRIFAMKKE